MTLDEFKDALNHQLLCAIDWHWEGNVTIGDEGRKALEALFALPADSPDIAQAKAKADASVKRIPLGDQDQRELDALTAIQESLADLDEATAKRFLAMTPADAIASAIGRALDYAGEPYGPVTATALVERAIALRAFLPAFGNDELERMRINVSTLPERERDAAEQAALDVKAKLESEFGERVRSIHVAAEEVERFVSQIVSGKRQPPLHAEWNPLSSRFDLFASI